MNKRYQHYVAGCIVALMVSGCGGGSSDTTSDEPTLQSSNDTHIVDGPYPIEAPALSQETIDAYLKAINDARAQGRDCGTAEDGTEVGYKEAADPVTWNDALYRASYEHSRDLALSNTFSHTGSATESDWTYVVQELSSGSTTQERIENNNYLNWHFLGENITAGYIDGNDPIDTPEEAVLQWIESPLHCGTLMSPDYTEVGMAYFYDANGSSEYRHYWTQVFGDQF